MGMSEIKELQQETGAGLLDCKKALIETNGDTAAAAKLLREKGLAAVAKRSERSTGEGRVFIRQNGNKIAAAVLVCETDFVSKNDSFLAAGEKILDLVFEKGYTEVCQELTDVVMDCATRTRENMSVSKVFVADIPEGACFGSYIHTDYKTAGIVVVKGSKADEVQEFARDCCMHLVAYTPAYTKKDDVPASYIDEQKDIFKAQMEQDEKVAGKPDNVKEGILAGKIKKHLGEICFVDQMFVKDDKKTVAAKLDEIGNNVGAKLEFGDIQLLVVGK